MVPESTRVQLLSGLDGTRLSRPLKLGPLTPAYASLFTFSSTDGGPKGHGDLLKNYLDNPANYAPRSVGGAETSLRIAASRLTGSSSISTKLCGVTTESASGARVNVAGR